MMRFKILFSLFWVAVSMFAQADRQAVRRGNRYYHQQQFAKAETEYRKAISINKNNTQALYNLGCALMMQQKDSLAIIQYGEAGKNEQSKKRKSMAYHNMGVVFQNNKMYGEAIEAYKESLRNNPSDNETRYNLELCKRLQKKQEQNKENKNNQDNKQQRTPPAKGKDNEERANQQPKKQMSKENAEQLLNAATQEERATQQRMKDAMKQPNRRKLEKNW